MEKSQIRLPRQLVYDLRSYRCYGRVSYKSCVAMACIVAQCTPVTGDQQIIRMRDIRRIWRRTCHDPRTLAALVHNLDDTPIGGYIVYDAACDTVCCTYNWLSAVRGDTADELRYIRIPVQIVDVMHKYTPGAIDAVLYYLSHRHRDISLARPAPHRGHVTRDIRLQIRDLIALLDHPVRPVHDVQASAHASHGDVLAHVPRYNTAGDAIAQAHTSDQTPDDSGPSVVPSEDDTRDMMRRYLAAAVRGAKRCI